MNFDEENFIIGYGARVGYAIMNKETFYEFNEGC